MFNEYIFAIWKLQIFYIKLTNGIQFFLKKVNLLLQRKAQLTFNNNLVFNVIHT